MLDLSNYSDLFIWKRFSDWRSEIGKQIITEGAGTGRPYDFYRTPYFVDILKDIDDEDLTVIGLKCASQIGKSRLLIAIALEWVKRYGTSVIYYAPKLETASEIFLTRLLPTVQKTPELFELLPKAKSSGAVRNGINVGARRITFINGGSIEIKQGRTNDAFKSSTAPLVICDELDEVAKQYKAENGDVIENLVTRTASFPFQNHKVIVASTPTRANFGIEKFWNTARQFRYYVTCPDCQHEWFADFSSLKWPHTQKSNSDTINSIISDRMEVTCECPACKVKHQQYIKTTITNSGRWKEEENELANKHYKCYHLSGIHSTRPWKELAITFLEAATDPDKHKQFLRQIVAEVKDNRGSKISKKTIAYGDYKLEEITSNLYYGIDVQTEKKELYIVALNLVDLEQKQFRIANYWSITYKSWDDFRSIIADILNQSPEFVGIDTGGGTTTRVYEIIDSLIEEFGESLIGLKGDRRARNDFYTSDRINNLLIVNPHSTNERLDDYILSGNIKFPQDVSSQFLKHLQNEIVSEKEGKLVYVPIYHKAQNDFRDALRYAMVMCLYRSESPKLNETSLKNILGL